MTYIYIVYIDSHILCYLIQIMTLQGRYDDPHFTDRENER